MYKATGFMRIPSFGIFLFISFSILFPSNGNGQTTYYLSSSQGNDSNSGTSETSAWKTIVKVNSWSFNPGDKILFKKGDTWTGEQITINNSGTASNPITYAAYGSGSKPVITLRQYIPNWNNPGNWSIYGSASGGGTIWEMAFPNFQLSAANYSINRLWLSGIEYVRAISVNGDNLDDLSGETKTYGVNSKHRFFHKIGTSPTLYVWTDSGSSNPANYYNNIEYSGKYTSNSIVYYTLILKDADYITLDGLDIRGGMFYTIVLNGSDNVIIRNCNIGWDANRAVLVGDQQLASDKTSENIEISNCTIDKGRRFKINFYEGGSTSVEYAIHAASGTSNWDIHDNFIKDMWFGFLTTSKYGESLNHKFYKNEYTAPDIDFAKPFQLGSQNSSFEDGGHKVYNNYFHDLSVGGQIGGGGGTSPVRKNNKIYFNIFANFTRSENEHATSGNSGFGISILESDNLYIFNNTFYNMNNVGIVDWSAGNTFSYNNLIVNTGLTLSEPYQVQIGYNNNYNYQNNLFYHSSLDQSVKIVNHQNIATYTISEFNGLTNVEKNIRHVGLVSSLVNTIDFALPKGSLALNAGADISSLVPAGFTDRVGNVVNRTNPNIGAISNASATIPPPDNSFISLNVKIFLQGAYNNGSMTTALNSNGMLPLTQPYNIIPWNYSGNESVTSIPSGVVDWVLVELRSDTSASAIVSRRAAFVKTDGTIVDIDGSSKVNLNASSGNYYVVIYHRNHLSTMSANKVSLSLISSLYDFTTSANNFYGAVAADLGNGKFGMFAGDGNANGLVNVLDYSNVGNNLFQSGYKAGDLDMNGIINVLDYGTISLNLLKFSKVP